MSICAKIFTEFQVLMPLDSFKAFILMCNPVCADDVPCIVCCCKNGSDVKITHCLLFWEWYCFHCGSVTIILWIVILQIHFLDFVLQFIEQDLMMYFCREVWKRCSWRNSWPQPKSYFIIPAFSDTKFSRLGNSEWGKKWQNIEKHNWSMGDIFILFWSSDFCLTLKIVTSYYWEM